MRLTVEQARTGCTWQRALCVKNAAPTYVALIDELVRRLDEGDAVAELLLEDGQDPVQSALCLRLFGAVNRIAMAESADWLDACYATRGGFTDVERVVPAFFGFLESHVDEVREQMKVNVQTNEVGRSAPLSAAMNHVSLATGLPLRLLEVGASAGLNMLFDGYFVDAGEGSWGPADSPLRLTGHFTSGRPAAAVPSIDSRAGCDLNPIDVHDPSSADLLRSFVWPEHVDRARRLEAALEVARTEPPLAIEASDACAWVESRLAELPSGVMTVVFHSVVATYFDPEVRDRFAKIIRAAGERAGDDNPLAWISLEPSKEDSSVVELVCETWPGDRRVLLARTTPHGTDVRWETWDGQE
ncbi:hypothetical protein N566_04760 [Streptomycetaceae bacterium MP113-05]|nr:hypothetical protein N566_04760 [Streptomycetaceae bacterium MP113-05]